MSYFTAANGTELIARRGYGGSMPTGLGTIDSRTPAQIAADTASANAGYGASSGGKSTLSKIGDFLKDGASAAFDIFKSSQQAAGGQAALQQAIQQQRPAASGMPSWLLPVGLIGAAGVVALVVLKKKRRNPARRYRRNRPGAVSRVGRSPLVPRRRRRLRSNALFIGPRQAPPPKAPRAPRGKSRTRRTRR